MLNEQLNDLYRNNLGNLMEMYSGNSSLKFEITAKRLYAAQPKSSLTV